MIILFAVLLLAGCNSEPPKELGKFVEVTVSDTKTVEECFKGCSYDYEVTLEKNETTVVLNVEREEMFNLLKKGNVVNITYNDHYYITEVTFPMMEKKGE